MSIDWASVGASAALSAAISFAMARKVVQRQEAGRSVVAGRRHVGKLVGPKLTEARQYQGRARSSLGRDADDRALHVDDVMFCARVLVAAAELGWLRRKLVSRRLGRLFGEQTVEFCALHGEDATTPDGVQAYVLQRQALASMHPEHQLSAPDFGEYDRALRCAPDSEAVADLVKSLFRLSRCR